MATTNGTPRTIEAEASAEAGRWTTLQEAATALGLSRDSVRRRVAARVLRAERRRTVRGPRLFVWLPASGLPDLVEPPEPADAGDDAAPRGGADAARGGAEWRTAAHSAAALATARAEEMARYTAVLLEPLHAQLKEQAERIGHLEEQLAGARARLAEVDPDRPQRAPAPEWEARRWWQRLLWG